MCVYVCVCVCVHVHYFFTCGQVLSCLVSPLNLKGFARLRQVKILCMQPCFLELKVETLDSQWSSQLDCILRFSLRAEATRPGEELTKVSDRRPWGQHSRAKL